VPEPPETKPEADVVQLPARKHQPRPARPKPGETPEERFARRSKSPDSRQLKAKEPEPGKRRCGCPLHKGKLVAIEQFDIKDKRRGTLTSWCSEGRKLYQRERYLSSKKIAKLGAVLEFVLADDDEHVGELCSDCERPCKAGERVVASAVSLHHAQHYRREISDADG
jgi:hypothetical protein